MNRNAFHVALEVADLPASLAFYRTLLAAGVPARCVTVMGTMHAVEVIPNVCPEISRAAARDVVGFARRETPPVRTPRS